MGAPCSAAPLRVRGWSPSGSGQQWPPGTLEPPQTKRRERTPGCVSASSQLLTSLPEVHSVVTELMWAETNRGLQGQWGYGCG